MTALGDVPVNAELPLAALATEITNRLVPAGATVPYAGATAPTGWLMCDGSTAAQATYPALYTAIGTAWNTGGEGGGNFRLPDLRGRVAVGLAPASPTGHADVDTLGETDAVALASRRPKHLHTVNSHAHTVADHSHYFTPVPNSFPTQMHTGALQAGGFLYSLGQHDHPQGKTAGATPATDAQSPGTDAQGPAYAVLNHIIKAH